MQGSDYPSHRPPATHARPPAHARVHSHSHVVDVLERAISLPLPSRLSTLFFTPHRTVQSKLQRRLESRQASLASVGCATPVFD